tara:strand:- start:233 stop:1087 length:855 start_codon:yes stop_codon:yes gene_type:complete
MYLALAVGFLITAKPFPFLAQVSGTTGSNTHKDLLTDPSPVFDSKAHHPLATVVPWSPGERIEYNVKVGAFSAGNAHMAVIGVDSIRGKPSYHVQMAIRGSFLYGAAQINNLYDSWIDTGLITTRRYIRDIHELNYKSYRQYEFYPEKMYWERIDNGESGELPTALPLDDIAFVYYVRTLPLEIGQTYTVSRYFKEEGNPVIIKVERKEILETPVGIFNTIVVRPVIKTRGLFSQGGDAELHFTDDENRYLVYLRSKIPIVGSVTLHVQSITPGNPIHIGTSGF